MRDFILKMQRIKALSAKLSNPPGVSSLSPRLLLFRGLIKGLYVFFRLGLKTGSFQVSSFKQLPEFVGTKSFHSNKRKVNGAGKSLNKVGWERGWPCG